MIKVKIQNVKEIKQNITKFAIYPFTIKAVGLITSGNIKVDLKKEEIRFKVERRNLINDGINNESYLYSLKYHMAATEEYELFKKLFYMTVCNSKKLFPDIDNWKIAFFKLIDENYQDRYGKNTYTLLEELLQYNQVAFKSYGKNSKYRLIISIINSVKVIREKSELMRCFDVQSLNNLNKAEICAYSNIMAAYLENKKYEGRINIEYPNQCGETIAKYCKPKKYTVLEFFSDEEII